MRARPIFALFRTTDFIETRIVQFSENKGLNTLNSDNLSDSERSLITLFIDAAYYEIQTSIEFRCVEDLVKHYLQTGWRNGFDPSPTFRAARYLNATAGLREAGKNPFAHYLFEKVGEALLALAFTGLTRSEVATLTANFDANWYLYNNPDVEIEGSDPFIHYMVLGWRESRDPSRRFSTGFYLALYPDIRACGMNPFQHWILHGLAEGRLGIEKTHPAFGSWESLSASQQSILVHIFSIDPYQSYAADLGLGGTLTLADYVDSGRDRSVNATPSFRASRYAATHAGLLDMEHIPFLQFLFGMVGESALRELFLGWPLEDVQTLCEHFDTAWYLYSYPDVDASGLDAFIHYMVFGWREHRDPSPAFSTGAYLVRYPDIAECGMNPFLHWVLYGRAEGRSGASSSSNFRHRPYAPSITAVLINSEHRPLSPDCFKAVMQQSYENLAVLVVGAPLSQSCRTILEVACSEGGKTVSFLPDDGSSSQCRLLQRAVDQATGDLIWFVEGREVHHAESVARLTSSFADESVQLGFGRRLDQDDYLIGENQLSLQMSNWTRHLTYPAAIWFSDLLEPDRLANDKQSFLWRRRRLAEDVWRRAEAYRHLGHLHLFLHMASGGQIASVRDALIRVSPVSEPLRSPLDDVEFYRDAGRLAAEIRSFWDVPHHTLEACGEALDKALAVHMRSFPAAQQSASFHAESLLEIKRIKRHVLIVTHGIFAGGAEVFPIQLANELAGRGIVVSMLIFKIDDVNAEIRATLNPAVSIYEAGWVLEYGCEKFVRDIGCSLIHSHGVVGEMFFFERCDCNLSVPYVSTLHGSYESSPSRELPESTIAKIVRNVDLFVYTADKNLAPLLRHDVKPKQLVKMINAMSVDETPFPRTRTEMGIAEDAVVFTLVARGIREKGWSTAIGAFKTVQKKNSHRAMHLCLVGEGEEPERLKPLHADDASISFLGFQLRIHGLYRLTDVAIVPTRFAGESYPLCVIQALQVAVPVIATDMGEIASMLQKDGVTGGVVVKSSRLDKLFEKRFADAMQALLDDERRKRLSLAAEVLGRGYSMSALTDRYVALYEDELLRFPTARPALPAVAGERTEVTAA